MNMSRDTLPLLLACLLAGCAPKPPHAAPSTPPVQGAASGSSGYDARLSAYPYPFAVQTRAFESQGQPLEMAYMDVAPEQPNGRAVLLLHGKNFSGAYWDKTIRALTARGFRVIVPDQIGFGKSSKPRNYQFTFHALAEHTRALLDALNVTRVSVVGHSMGGMLATRFTLLHGARVDRLALVNPIGLEDWSRSVPYAPVEANYQRELSNDREKIRGYMRDSYFAGQWKPEYEPLVEMLAGWSEGPDRELMAWVAALTTDMVFTQPVVHDFPRLALPTLLVIGTRDRTAIGKALVPPEVAQTLGNYEQLGKSAAHAIPNAELVELPGIGHMPQVEAFDDYIAALTKFLER